uniref:Uncharacterized protein n=1 Tax=Pyricularia oryzae (strain P131) TaxID=1143193 RepID=L7J9K4_PYRO1
MWEICMWDPHDQTGPLGRKELRGNFHKGITPREIVKQITVRYCKGVQHNRQTDRARYSLLYGYGTMGDNEVTDPGWI